MPQPTELKIAHLSMIQGVISRMASNSFALKALSLAFISAVVSFAGTQDDPHLFIAAVGLFPLAVLWILDVQYLRLERLYRKLFDHVRLDKEIESFSMNTNFLNGTVQSTVRIAFSWSVLWYYLALLIVLLAAVGYLTCT